MTKRKKNGIMDRFDPVDPIKYVAGAALAAVIGNHTAVFRETWLSLFPSLVLEILVGFSLILLVTNKINNGHIRWMLTVGLAFVTLAVATGTTWNYVRESSFILGSKRLRGLVYGIHVPSSDFCWSTNGSVVATPIEAPNRAMRVKMILKGEESWADTGWGIDLARWSFQEFGPDYDAELAAKSGVRFYIRGEEGGERIGISMKSDCDSPSSCGAESNEDKLPLSRLGITVTPQWQPVRVPFQQLPYVVKQRARNIAFYTNRAIMGKDRDTQTVYLKRITFYKE